LKFVVFFRNLNLARPPAPTRAQFEGAFLTAGATSAESFLTNGTLVFAANTRIAADKVLKRACAVLQGLSGFKEPAFMRELAYLAGLVRREPFAAVERGVVYELCATFFDKDLVLPPDPPCENKRKDVLAVAYTPSEFLSVAYKLGASPGSPNAFFDKELGCPSTTRAWNTVCRLVKKFA
jgi:uncharacterized protein (DUF1697 family)